MNPETELRPWAPAPIALYSQPGARSAALLDAVIDQFHVGTSPRYAVRDANGDGIKDTFCNVFAWDVSRACGRELPHWINADGSPSLPGGASLELSINRLIGWLKTHGQRFGWNPATRAFAHANANAGAPSIVTYANPGGHGHIAVIRPNPADLTIAQAGGVCFDRGPLARGFGNLPVEFWIAS